MLPLEIIKKFYPNASEYELKEIQEIVYLLACAVMQHFYGPPLGEPRLFCVYLGKKLFIS